jgi:hypothetical protein
LYGSTCSTSLTVLFAYKVRGVFKSKRDYVNLTKIVAVRKTFTSYDFST